MGKGVVYESYATTYQNSTGQQPGAWHRYYLPASFGFQVRADLQELPASNGLHQHDGCAFEIISIRRSTGTLSLAHAWLLMLGCSVSVSTIPCVSQITVVVGYTWAV